MSNLQKGDKFENYTIVEEVGNTVTSTVYKATEVLTGKDVAIKVIKLVGNKKTFDFDVPLNFFFQELRALNRFKHTHMVELLDWGFIKGMPPCTYIVMPFYGRTLASIYPYGERIDWQSPSFSNMLNQIGGVLQYLHFNKVVHTDLKPSNIMVDEAGNVLLGDFGLARSLEKLQSSASTFLWASPNYASPEILNQQKSTARADLYSLAAIIYQLLSGYPPFYNKKASPVEIAFAQVNKPIPTEPLNKIPSEIARIVIKALAKNPEDRHHKVSTFVQELQKAIQVSMPTVPVKLPTQEVVAREATSKVNPYGGKGNLWKCDPQDHIYGAGLSQHGAYNGFAYQFQADTDPLFKAVSTIPKGNFVFQAQFKLEPKKVQGNASCGIVFGSDQQLGLFGLYATLPSIGSHQTTYSDLTPRCFFKSPTHIRLETELSAVPIFSEYNLLAVVRYENTYSVYCNLMLIGKTDLISHDDLGIVCRNAQIIVLNSRIWTL